MKSKIRALNRFRKLIRMFKISLIQLKKVHKVPKMIKKNDCLFYIYYDK